MKKVIIISTLLLLFNCKNKPENLEFTQEDAYEVINFHIKNQLTNENSILYWNNRQLKKPDFEQILGEFNGILVIKEKSMPMPVFTTEYWNMNKINKIKPVDWEIYNSFFKKNHSVDLQKLWSTKFNDNYVHNVSYPIYDKKSKTVIIKDYVYRPFLSCGTGLDNTYFYKKTEQGWKR